MDQDKKTNKKKILTLYLILGACILVIAAITVTVILAVNNSNRGFTLDEENNTVIDGGDNNEINNGDVTNGGNDTIDGNTNDNSTDNSTDDVTNNNGNESGDNSAVATKYEFISPIENIDLINSYTFYKNNTLNCYYFHKGLDFAAEKGTPVYACLDGEIESITTGDVLDGTVITIVHDNGIKSCYKFIDADEQLKVGDRVERGDVIGTVAEANGCEYKDGAHLHFEIYSQGQTDDPENYLDISAK
jgi:murein DD-endopeptidase MepM/ murein hydrolase activator NlpD